MVEPGFWDNQELAQRTTKDVSVLRRIIQEWQAVHELYEDTVTLLELWEESGDESLHSELIATVPRLEKAVDELELASLLSGEYDSNNAILTIHPGAGDRKSVV